MVIFHCYVSSPEGIDECCADDAASAFQPEERRSAFRGGTWKRILG